MNTFPDLPVAPALAHGPLFTTDPITGRIFLVYTVSNEDGTSETVFTRSSSGVNWSAPVSISGSGHNDFAEITQGPDGNLYVAWEDFPGATNNSFMVFRSTDGFGTWRPATLAGTVPKSGTPGQCQDSNARSVLGQVVALDAPEIAVSPFHRNRVYVAFPGHGEGVDESDIFFARSNDGGATWPASGRGADVRDAVLPVAGRDT